MSMSVNFEPFKNQGALGGGFNVESRGLTQGDAHDDPAVRLQLCSGSLVDSLDAPIWGGVGVVECIATSETNVTGSAIKKATASACNAFTVVNQAFHGVTTAGNPVPLFVSGGSVHYYRIGSGARIPLPISEEVAALATGDEAVGADGFVWDLQNNCIDVYSSATSGNPKVNISLVMVSMSGNLTVEKDPDTGNVKWNNEKPCGLFLI